MLLSRSAGRPRACLRSGDHRSGRASAESSERDTEQSLRCPRGSQAQRPKAQRPEQGRGAAGGPAASLGGGFAGVK